MSNSNRDTEASQPIRLPNGFPDLPRASAVQKGADGPPAADGATIDANYLRLAEKSVAQLILQSCDWRRSSAIHKVKLIKIITVATSLAKTLSFTHPAPTSH